MKKHIILALFLALLATGAFAKGIDLGAGMLFNWGSRNLEPSSSYTAKENFGDFGLYGFVGWKYFDIDLGITFRDYSYSVDGVKSPTILHYFGGQAGFNFKVPINILWWFRIFPTIGVGLGLGGNSDSTIKDDTTYFDLGARAGLGADFLVWRNMFVRGVFQYNFNFTIHPKDAFVYPACFFMKFAVGWLL